MNVDHIYQFQRDEAFAKQFSSEFYETFVAMPFSNRGGYPERRIGKMLLDDVHNRANILLGAVVGQRTFAPLKRVDGGGPGGALTITDEIVSRILDSHFFVGDITGCNFGVVLETGVALALKPNARVLLFTQDDTASLHFDLRVTNVNRYTEENLVDKAAHALIGAAKAFEKEAARYITLLSSQLTPDAIVALKIYARLWAQNEQAGNNPSIWEDSAAKYSKRFRKSTGRIAFHNVVRELSDRRLFWTHYVPGNKINADTYGIHATELGWRVIEHLWKNESQIRKPPNAPTGPNLL